MRIGFERQPLLGFFHRVRQPRLGPGNLPQVEAVFLAKTVADEIEQELVEVVSAQLRVAVAGEHLHDALLDLDDRHIKRPAAQVVDQEPLVLVRLRLVDQRGSRRFVDDPQDVEAREFAGFAGRFALGFVEERRNGDHRLLDRLFQDPLGLILQAAQDHGRDLLGREGFGPERNAHVLAHLPFDRLHGALGEEDRLVARRLADDQLPVHIQSHDRGQNGLSVGGLQHHGLAVANDRHAAVGRSEIDSQDGVHRNSFPRSPHKAGGAIGAGGRTARTSAQRTTRLRHV